MYETPFNQVSPVSEINTSHDQHASFMKSYYISQAKEQIYKDRYDVIDVLNIFWISEQYVSSWAVKG